MDTYDTGQLTDVTGAETNSYDYDANGNRSNAHDSDVVNNQALNDGTYTYTYDAEGIDGIEPRRAAVLKSSIAVPVR